MKGAWWKGQSCSPEVRALQRQVQALQEEIRREMNIVVGDKSEEKNEEKGNNV